MKTLIQLWYRNVRLAVYQKLAGLHCTKSDDYTESAVLFNYKDIRLSGVYPSVGPQSGGTQLAITGMYLNIGSTISAYLDELQCHVNATQASSSRLTCVTSKSDRCHATGCPSGDITTSLMDNVNKLLIADLESQTLIARGSLLQGACEKYKMSNISIKPEFIPHSVAANDENSSTYAFIGPERYKNTMLGDKQIYSMLVLHSLIEDVTDTMCLPFPVEICII
ncbi:Plexin-B [Eufriesea mexicana]|uniref:Plexin-B n=1 Tax=Eufriesea mexicana TaxID=516756 RepID=A0A310SDU9_9HYME|nr:Plexin-B [Eufriesea mexicana]